MIRASAKLAILMFVLLLAVLDEFIETDHERRDQPAYGGIVVLHRLRD